jgi:hypothetical protein
MYHAIDQLKEEYEKLHKCLYNGENFNKMFKLDFYKILKDDLIHNNYEFKHGLNIDTIKFEPYDESKYGGIYFTEIDKIGHWLNYTENLKYIAKITIPNDAKVSVETNKFKADKIFIDLDNKCLIEDFPLFDNLDFCKLIIKENGLALKFIKSQTPELCKLAIEKNANALQYVHIQTPELCNLAVSIDGDTLQYVHIQTPELCKLAIMSYGLALKYVKNQTDELCELAVQINGLSLEHVKIQTPKICELAVKQNGLALKYIKFQTKELCEYAKYKEKNYMYCIIC